jgi:hypothetical protein
MDGSFQTLEKRAEFHSTSHKRKATNKDHKPFSALPSQPAGNLAIQRLLPPG